MRAFVGAALEAEGIEVTEARTGFEALKMLPQGRFDLVVTDINMPDINGLEVIRFTRNHERYRDTPLIIISTEGREVDRDKAMSLGANEYLVKPFRPDELMQAVRRYLPKD
jgi:two-component system chemotaxis response regulator CheY